MFCKYCGTKLNATDFICPGCSSPIDYEVKSEPVVNTPKPPVTTVDTSYVYENVVNTVSPKEYLQRFSDRIDRYAELLTLIPKYMSSRKPRIMCLTGVVCILVGVLYWAMLSQFDGSPIAFFLMFGFTGVIFLFLGKKIKTKYKKAVDKWLAELFDLDTKLCNAFERDEYIELTSQTAFSIDSINKRVALASKASKHFKKLKFLDKYVQ